MLICKVNLSCVEGVDLSLEKELQELNSVKSGIVFSKEEHTN